MGGMVLQLYGEEVWELDFGRTPEIHRNYILKKKDDSCFRAVQGYSQKTVFDPV